MAHIVLQAKEEQEEYAEAHRCYSDALAADDEAAEECLSEADRALCRGGLARTTVLLGDFVRGRELAIATGDAELIAQCAGLLDRLQQVQASRLPDNYLRVTFFEPGFFSTSNLREVTSILNDSRMHCRLLQSCMRSQATERKQQRCTSVQALWMKHPPSLGGASNRSCNFPWLRLLRVRNQHKLTHTPPPMVFAGSGADSECPLALSGSLNCMSHTMRD